MTKVVNVEVRGLRDVQNSIRMFGAEVVAGVKKALDSTGIEMVSDVRDAIKHGPKSGTVYYRIPGEKYMTIRAGSETGPPVAFVPGGGKQGISLVHQASAPGQAPASDTGALAGSIYYRMIDQFTLAVGSRLPYSEMLEFGTMKIKPRRAWIPAAERAAPRLEKRIRRVIAEARARAEGKTR